MSQEPEIEKVCTRCGIKKPLSEFYHDVTKIDLHKNICAECYRKYEKEPYKITSRSFTKEMKDFLQKEVEWRIDPEDNNLLQVKCKYCKEWFNPSNDQIKKFRIGKLSQSKSSKDRHGNLYCSETCKENCPDSGKYRNPIKITNVRLAHKNRINILIEHEYKCDICGKEYSKDNSSELECHHIYPRKVYSDLVNDNDKILLLCKDCHRKIHTSIRTCTYKYLRNLKVWINDSTSCRTTE